MVKTILKILFISTLFFLVAPPFFKKIGAYQYPLSDAEIVLSDSNPGATNVEYKFKFTTAISLSSGQTITINFPDVYQSPVATSVNVFCPQNMTSSVEERMIICTVNPGQTYPPTSTEILVLGVTNPAKEAPFGVADIHFVTIETSAGEGASLPVTIIETMKVSGTIHPILSFEIKGLDVGETVHGTLVTTASTTASSIGFQDIPINTPVLGAQDIFVTTNAGLGFRLNLIQNSDLMAIRDGRVYRIFCFENGRCKAVENAISWIKPEGILGDPKTYGHFGITSEDNSLGENCTFNYYGFGQNPKWAGPDVNSPIEIMRNCGPADGQTRHQGWTRVGFQVEVTPLQPAGNYQTTFTYVLTPIF